MKSSPLDYSWLKEEPMKEEAEVLKRKEVNKDTREPIFFSNYQFYQS